MLGGNGSCPRCWCFCRSNCVPRSQGQKNLMLFIQHGIKFIRPFEPYSPSEFKDLFPWNKPRLWPNPIPDHKMPANSLTNIFWTSLRFSTWSTCPLSIKPSSIPLTMPIFVASIACQSMVFGGGHRAWNTAGHGKRERRGRFLWSYHSYFCRPVARPTLALRIPSLLRWSQSRNPIADGFLYLSHPSDLDKRGVQFEKNINEQMLKLFGRLRERRASHWNGQTFGRSFDRSRDATATNRPHQRTSACFIYQTPATAAHDQAECKKGRMQKRQKKVDLVDVCSIISNLWCCRSLFHP